MNAIAEGQAQTLNDVVKIYAGEEKKEKKDVKSLEKTIEAIEIQIKECSVFEQEARKLLKKKREELQVHLTMAKKGIAYKPIDMSFLRQRRYDKKLKMEVPLFAVFDHRQRPFTLSSTTAPGEKTKNRIEPRKQVCKEQFQDVCVSLEEHTQRVRREIVQRKSRKGLIPRAVVPLFGLALGFSGWIFIGGCLSIFIFFPTFLWALTINGVYWAESNEAGNLRIKATLSATFAGLLPGRTRKRIKMIEKHFDSLLLITEVPEWELNKTYTILKIDPLLIGKSGDKYFLLDKFETTSAEEYVAREFTT